MYEKIIMNSLVNTNYKLITYNKCHYSNVFQCYIKLLTYVTHKFKAWARKNWNIANTVVVLEV